MRTTTWLGRAGWLCTFAFLTWTIPAARADEPPPPKVAGHGTDGELGPAIEFVPKPLRRPNVFEKVLYQESPGKYTLKLALTRVPKSLAAQLKLDDSGALVVEVTDGGPAEKAGIKVHDVIVTVADKPIKNVSDVLHVVNDSDGKELTFKIVRAGEPVTVVVTPAESHRRVRAPSDEEGDYRQAAEAAAREAQKAASEATKRVQLELRDLEKQLREKLKDAGVDVRLQFVQPGHWIPRDFTFSTEKPAEFPDDLSVEIHKRGKAPTRIEVKQGDKSWTVTDDKLDELPEEVRGHVARLLGRGGNRFYVKLPDDITAPKISAEAREKVRVQVEHARKRAEAAAEEARARGKVAAEEARERASEMRARMQERLERRLDEMSREMREMRKYIEELRGRSSEHDEDEKPKADKTNAKEDDSDDSDNSV